MKRAFILALSFMAVLSMSACYRTVYTGENLGYLATLNGPKPDEKVISQFRKKLWNHYFLYGLFPTSDMNVTEIISRDVPPGHAVRNLTIRHQASFGNMFVSFLTFSLYTPMTTIITGDIVQTDQASGGVAQRQ